MKSKLIFWFAVIFNLMAVGVNGWAVSSTIALNLVILINVGLFALIQFHWAGIFKKLTNASGLTEKANESEKSLEKYIVETGSFIRETQLAMSNINEIGQETFTELVQGIKNETIKTSLLSANSKIIALRKKENENNWITQGVASIADLKHKGNDLAEYTFQIISTVVKYLNANQGGFFLLTGEEGDPYFQLTASYAYGKKKYLEKRINPGEGLIGQVFYEKEIVYLTEVPGDYVKITSGLGEALPRCICLVPLLSEGKIHGVIEIASFHKLQPFEMDYLRKISESIGYNLNSIHTHQRTEFLLQEAQKMAQEVKAQEEELRQNMEELTATQEQMRRKQSEIDTVLASLSTVELDLNGNITQANEIFLGITGYILNDIQGKLYKNLIPQYGNDPIQYEMMWSSILSGRSFSGEFRIVNQAGKEMWMAGNFTPIINDSGNPYKVMVISLFTTQDKEKLFELQELVTALKSCFPMAELNNDMTFKTANDLFLTELGIKRIELKKLLPRNVLGNGSFGKVEKYLKESIAEPGHVELDIQDKAGTAKRFNTTLIKINNDSEAKKRGLLILRNVV